MLEVSFIGLILMHSFVKIVLLVLELQRRSQHQISQLMFSFISMSLICDKNVTTQNLAFLSYWYRKKRLQMHF